MSYQYIDSDKINNMLFNDQGYISEFCEAGVASFEEFIEHYRCHLLQRNMEKLRKAGHKIKPGALMMGAEEVVEEYERAKQLLRQEADEKKLQHSVTRMRAICTSIQDELTQLGNSI